MHAPTDEDSFFLGVLQFECGFLEAPGMGRGQTNFRRSAPQHLRVVRHEPADVEQASGLTEEPGRVGVVALVAAAAAVSGSGHGQSVKL
ncbi:MAG: hypothetical protein LC792_05240 [Actinobacteria bacterium]|nr:hypothetical protein [Actinomycetota bacterium]